MTIRILLHRIGLLFGEVEGNLFLRFVHRPSVVLLVLDEVKEEEYVAEVDEAIGLVCLIRLPIIHNQV